MPHFGNIPAGTTLYIPFETFGKTNGESITLTGLAITDIEIYKNGSVTQRASDNGYALLDTDGTDFDGLTGIHGFSVNLADNSDSGFFSVGGFYWVAVSSVTVDGQVINFIAATFRIVAAEVTTGYPEVGVSAVGLATDAVTELQTGLATAATLTLVKAKTDLIPAAPAATSDIPTANQNAAALLDLTDGVETGLTVRGTMRLQAAALFGKVSGAGTTTEIVRAAVSDSKVRITYTDDASGNRTAVVTDAT